MTGKVVHIHIHIHYKSIQSKLKIASFINHIIKYFQIFLNYSLNSIQITFQNSSSQQFKRKIMEGLVRFLLLCAPDLGIDILIVYR